MDKHAGLLALAKIRQGTRWEGYKCIGDYHDGVYECDFVSPYTKSAGNVDADIMVLLQDWWSDAGMSGTIDEDSVKLGYGRSNRTDRNLIKLLDTTFGLTFRDIYATNLFPFIKLGAMNASIRQSDLIRAAREFALPQIRVVNPRLVICLGLVTFNAVRQARDLDPCRNIDGGIQSPFSIDRTRVWCQAHTGQQGQNMRNRGGVIRVPDDWRRMKLDMTTAAGSMP